jgi:hypothetical protein
LAHPPPPSPNSQAKSHREKKDMREGREIVFSPGLLILGIVGGGRVNFKLIIDTRDDTRPQYTVKG